MALTDSAPTGQLDAGAVAQLRELEAMSPGLISQMSGLFLDEGARGLEQMQAAEATGDHETIASVAHSLKGSSLALGALEVGALAGELEAASRGRQPVGKLLSRLQLALDVTRPSLEALVAPKP